MEREIKKGSSPLKLDHIEFGDYSYQEIMSQEKLFVVLTYLLRIGDFKQYAGKIILNNVYMDLRWKKPVFKRTKTAMERNNIFATIRRYVKKLKPQYNGDVYLETVRCYFDISQENLEKCRYTYQGNETSAFLGTPVFICPTIASTDAPCSALSVIYTEEGVFEKYLFLPANPNLVLMDTDIITKSPVRLTVAGMGDALATYFEARACKRSGATSCAGGKTTEAAMALAELCFNTLMDEGVKAKIALEAGVCTPAVEKVIEANTLLSGIGFESAGLAGAHAIHNGFTVLEECHHMYHGEKVAFGTITQLVLENIPQEDLEEIILWCIEVGLPVTLAELGAGKVTDEQLMEVATTACAENDTLHNMPFEVTPETVFAAIKAADAYGRYYLDEE